MKPGTKGGVCSVDTFTVHTFQVTPLDWQPQAFMAVSVFSLVAGTTLGETERDTSLHPGSCAERGKKRNARKLPLLHDKTLGKSPVHSG